MVFLFSRLRHGHRLRSLAHEQVLDQGHGTRVSPLREQGRILLPFLLHCVDRSVTKKKPPAEGRGLVPDTVIAADQRE
jgi:hypothetical protein